MARPKKTVEVPGQETKTDEIDTTLENSLITPRNPLSEFAEGVNAIANSPAGAELANTAAELNAATAGATVIAETTTATGTAPIIGTDPAQGDSTATVTVDLTARNAALSELNAEGFAIITKFEAYGFVDEIGHELTSCIDFIDLVKAATLPALTVSTSRGRSAAVVNEDGAQHAAPGKPMLTKDGWHIPG